MIGNRILYLMMVIFFLFLEYLCVISLMIKGTNLKVWGWLQQSLFITIVQQKYKQLRGKFTTIVFVVYSIMSHFENINEVGSTLHLFDWIANLSIYKILSQSICHVISAVFLSLFFPVFSLFVSVFVTFFLFFF